MSAGILFSVLAAVTLNVGNLIQKHAVNGLPSITAKRVSHMIRTLATSGTWMAGFLLCLVGVGLQVMAFSLAPIAVVQTIFSACIVLLLVVSRLKLHEHLKPFEWTGLAVVIASVVAVSVTLQGSPKSSSSPASIPVLVATLTPTLLVAVLLILRVERAGWSSGLRYGIAAGLLYGAAGLGTKGASTLVAHHDLAGSIALIATSVYPYMFIAFSGVAMLIYQMGIQRFKIAVVGVMSDVVSSTYIVAVGAAVFGESLPQDRVMVALRLSGFAGVLIGTVIMAGGGFGRSTVSVPMSEADLGIGSLLAAEVAVLRRRTLGPPRQVPELDTAPVAAAATLPLPRTGPLFDAPDRTSSTNSR